MSVWRTRRLYRVLRGGGWGRDPRSARVAFRSSYTPGYRDVYLGLRLVRRCT